MITRAKTPQLHLLPVLDLLGIAVAPFYRDVGICISVDQNVECAVPIELRQEGDGSGDLSEYRLDLCLDFFLGFLGRWLIVLSIVVSA